MSEHSFRFAFVSNSRAIAEAVREYAQGRGMGMEIRLASMEKALPVARELLENGVEVILGGGGTGRLLRGRLQRPVVTISNDHLSVLRSLMQARQYSSSIAVTCYERIPEWVGPFAELLHISILPILFTTTQEHVQGIASAVRMGVGCIVGGGICAEVAQAQHCPAVIVMPSLRNLERALDEAVNIAVAMRRDNERLAWMSGMVEVLHEGIVGIDADERLVLCNEMARHLFPQDGARESGSPLVERLQLRRAMQGSCPVDGIVPLDKGRELLFSAHPVMVRGKSCGAFAVFSPASRVKELSNRLKRNRHHSMAARYTFADIIGESPVMHTVREKARCFAASGGALYIHGESGTGKELFAHAVHQESPQRKGPFVALNCGALPETLLESELFGYEEGAFTGARRGGKEGLLDVASGGTIFLDEIGDISPAVQVRLLRVLETGEIYRLGGERPYTVQVRVISSSWKDLVHEVRAGRFRADLFYRLSLLRLDVPPLRERKEDIPLLAQRLLERSGYRLSPLPESFAPALQEYDWPGNIRELDALLQRYALLLGTREHDFALWMQILQELRMRQQELMPRDAADAGANASGEGTLRERMERVEAAILRETLRRFGGSRKKVATALDLSLNTLWRKMRQHHLV